MQYIVEYKVFDAVIVDALDEEDAKVQATEEIYGTVQHDDFELMTVLPASKELLN